MALNLEQKKEIVAELTKVAGNSVSAIAVDYRGLTVSEMTELRVNARKSGVHMRVYKNTLACEALKETNFSCLEKALVGPIVLFFSQDEPGIAARLLRDFAKGRENFKVRALALDGNLLGPDRLQAVASLPSRQEALAQMLAVLKAPITKMVRTVREPYAQVVRVLAAIGNAKKTQ